LAELDDDLRLHIHKENNILFPMALAREAEFANR
jgi:iron-sulfur cluster repair protein YtfE (RIC family)